MSRYHDKTSLSRYCYLSPRTWTDGNKNSHTHKFIRGGCGVSAKFIHVMTHIDPALWEDNPYTTWEVIKHILYQLSLNERRPCINNNKHVHEHLEQNQPNPSITKEPKLLEQSEERKKCENVPPLRKTREACLRAPARSTVFVRYRQRGEIRQRAGWW